MYGEMRPGSHDVGEYARRAAKYVVLQFYAFVHRHVILNADAVAYLYVIRYIHILSQRAVFSDNRSFLDM